MSKRIVVKKHTLRNAFYLLLLFNFLFQNQCFSNVDSLKIQLSKAKTDSAKISLLELLSESCPENEILEYCNQNIQLLERALNKKKISLRFYEIGKAKTYSNIGFYHFSVSSNYIEALDHLLKAIPLIEKYNDSTLSEYESLSSIYNLVSATYYRLEKFSLAEKYLHHCILIDKKKGNKNYLTTDYNNIAALFVSTNQLDKALYYYNLALADQDSTPAFRVRYCNIAVLYIKKKDFQQAEYNLQKAFRTLKKNSDSSAFFYPFKVKFELLCLQNNYAEAAKLIPLLEKFSIGNTNIPELAGHFDLLHKYYQKTGNYKLALEAYKQSKTLSDSVLNEDIKVKSEIKQLTFDFDKKQLGEMLKSEKTLVEEKEKRQKQMLILLFTVLVAIIISVFTLIVFKKFKLTQKQNQIIEEQNSKIQSQHQLLEIKNKAITDSINYSKSIQSTLLANYNTFENYFKESFVIYEPKDVIGGDFYWTQNIGDNLLIAVGDCTGHGVPGALISVLAIESLNKTYPTISNLNNLDELITQLRNEFNKYYESNSLVSIGIDLSLIYINKKDHLLFLAGSGATVLYVKDATLTKFKFDSYNIGGKSPVNCNAEVIQLELTDNQLFYLFTDGVVDMKGGEAGKRFSMKNLESTLLNLYAVPFQEQKIYLDNVIAEWNKNSERIDDITLLAIKI